MDHQSIIDQIGNSKSLTELDKIAIDYYSNVERGFVSFDRVIELAIRRREIELSEKETYLHNMGSQKTNKTEVAKDNTVPFDLNKKKAALGNAVPNIVSLKDVRCNCKQAYGVACIHKASFPGILPDDYEYCKICGCDHKHDTRLAKEVHESLGEQI